MMGENKGGKETMKEEKWNRREGEEQKRRKV